MMTCDLCGEDVECLQKEIDGKEFDVCERCWLPLAKKLDGKGRVKQILEEVEGLQKQGDCQETLI
jgi:hypothetical protein